MTYLLICFDLLIGLLLYSFIEYAHHRWGGHTKWLPSLRKSHASHHHDPMEGGVRIGEKLRQRARLVVVALCLIGAPLFALLPAAHAAALLAGTLAGYLYSEWFHHRMHHQWPTGPVGRYLWKHHYIHHFVDGRVNYGFTSPLWDVLLGTLRVEEQVRVPAHRAPKAPVAAHVGIVLKGRRAA